MPRRKTKADVLVGRVFVIWESLGYTRHRGRVVAALPEGFYLVKLFDLVDVDDTSMPEAIFHVSKLVNDRRAAGSFTFFQDEDHLKRWLKREYVAPVRMAG